MTQALAAGAAQRERKHATNPHGSDVSMTTTVPAIPLVAPSRMPRAAKAGLALLGIALGAVPAATAQRADPDPHMAPIAQYLIPDRSAEIALARSAAPAAISRDATIMVLGRAGFEPAVEGSNGFVCLVERSWDSPFDSPGFWNARIRGPACYNPAAARSVLPVIYARTRLALAGQSRDQILDSIRAAFAAHALPSPAPGSMSYMLSKLQRIGDQAVRWLPHLMFELPRTADGDWGANLSGSPILLHQDTLNPITTEFLIPVGRWSDGTPAPSH